MDAVLENFVQSEAAKKEDALKDLERIEQEIMAEAQASVQDYDAMGNIGAAAAAAETAQVFEEAQFATAAL